MALARSRTFSTVLLAIGAAGALVLTGCSSNNNSGQPFCGYECVLRGLHGSIKCRASSAASTASIECRLRGVQPSLERRDPRSPAGRPRSPAARLRSPHTGVPAPAALTQRTSTPPRRRWSRRVADGLHLAAVRAVRGRRRQRQDRRLRHGLHELASPRTSASRTKIVDADFSGIQSGQAMQSKQCDIAAAGMTITPERAKAIAFSLPYYDATQALMVLSTQLGHQRRRPQGQEAGRPVRHHRSEVRARSTPSSTATR